MIWLIGNKGMLGHDVEDLLKKEDLKYFATDIETDITSLNALKQYVQHKQFNYIINCAAYTDVDGAEKEIEKAYCVNWEGVRNIALVAKENNAILIHISTDYVFDGKKEDPYKEEDMTKPLSVYGKSKLKGEEDIQELLEKYFILRTAWLYGKYGKNFIYTLLQLFQKQDEIKVTDEQSGSPTYTVDLAKILIEIIKTGLDQYGIYHFTNEGITTWYGFAKAIYKIAKKTGLCSKEVNIAPIKTEEYPLPAVRPEYSLLSKEKIKDNLKINIREWKDALKEFMENL